LPTKIGKNHIKTGLSITGSPKNLDDTAKKAVSFTF
jgi:hypothetical protein